MEYDDTLYDELVEVEEQLETETSQMGRIRLERRLAFIHKRIDEMEQYMIDIGNDIKAEEERIANVERSTELAVSTLRKAFRQVIEVCSDSNALRCSLHLGTLRQIVEGNIRFYGEAIISNSNELRDLCIDLLSSVNNNPNLTLDYSTDGMRLQRTISKDLKAIFSLFNLEDLDVEFVMDTDSDEALARQLQDRFSLEDRNRDLTRRNQAETLTRDALLRQRDELLRDRENIQRRIDEARERSRGQ